MKPIMDATTAGGACTAAVFGNLEAIWLLNTTVHRTGIAGLFSDPVWTIGGVCLWCRDWCLACHTICQPTGMAARTRIALGGAAAIIPMVSVSLSTQQSLVCRTGRAHVYIGWRTRWPADLLASLCCPAR